MSAPLRPGTRRCMACYRPRPLRLLFLVEGVGARPTYLCTDRPECRDKLRERGLGQIQLSKPPGGQPQ